MTAKKTPKAKAPAKKPVGNKRVNVTKPGDRVDMPDTLGGMTQSEEVTGIASTVEEPTPIADPSAMGRTGPTTIVDPASPAA